MKTPQEIANAIANAILGVSAPSDMTGLEDVARANPPSDMTGLEDVARANLPGVFRASALSAKAWKMTERRDGGRIRNRAQLARRIRRMEAQHAKLISADEREALAILREHEHAHVRNYTRSIHSGWHASEPQYIAEIGNPRDSGKNYGDTMPTNDHMRLCAVVKGEIVGLAELRIHYAKSGTYNRATLWVHIPRCKAAPDGFRTSGSGHAGGCGYHRPSQAAAHAFASAGIKLAHDIGGVGDSAMKEALFALGDHFGFRNMDVI